MLRFSKYPLPSGFHDKYLSPKRAIFSTYLIHLDLITVSPPHKLINKNDGLIARIEDRAPKEILTISAPVINRPLVLSCKGFLTGHQTDVVRFA
jgi:hypothetical protein